MNDTERAGEPRRHRGSLDNRAGTASGATVIETGRAAFSLPGSDPAMPATEAERPRSAEESAASGQWYDPDHGTRWEGLVAIMPRFRAAPICKVTLSGRHRAAEALSTSRAAEKAKRRNARKEAKAKAVKAAPDARAGKRGGMVALIAALRLTQAA